MRAPVVVPARAGDHKRNLICFWQPQQVRQLGDVRGRRAPRLFELHHGRLDVLTPRTFEGAHIKTGLPRRDARQKHLRRASRAIWTRVNRRVFECVFGKRHFATFLFAGGSAGTLSHRHLDRIAVGDVLKVTLFPCGTVRNGSPPGLQRASLPCNPCELFDTESESDTAQSRGCRALPRPPASQSARAVCVRTRPQ